VVKTENHDMPKLKAGHISPTPEEDAIINAGIAADPEAQELDDEWFASAKPARDVLPPEVYAKLIEKTAIRIPAAVVDLAMDNDWSAARAWREHAKLTQAQVAQRMGITLEAYMLLESEKVIESSTREKIAKR
jgi:DNA-binding XRE family transcriptional regulator